MKRFLLVLVFFLVFSAQASAGGFRPVTPMDTGRLEPAVATLQDGGVLVAGGHTGPSGATRSAEVYDPASSSWRKVGSLNIPRTGATATTLQDGRVLVVGGQRGRAAGWNPLASAEIFNPLTNSFQMVGAAPAARAYGAANLLADGRVLLWGGKGSAATEPTSQFFNPAGSVFQSAGLPRPALIGGSTNISLANGAMRIGGYLPGAATRNTLLWNGSWQTMGSLRSPRAEAAGLVLPSGKVLVAGGTARGRILGSTEVFQGGSWSRSRPLRNPRLGAEMALAGGKPMLLSGWVGGKATDRTEVLFRKGWRPGPRMMWARWGATAHALSNNSFLLLGGVSPRGLLRGTRRSAEIYDPNLRAPWARIVRGPDRKTSSRAAQFLFTSKSKSNFEYRLDRGRWKKTGRVLRIKKLSIGKHVLRVRTRVYKLRSPADAWRWQVRP